jgi:hypothetical protein
VDREEGLLILRLRDTILSNVRAVATRSWEVNAIRPVLNFSGTPPSLLAGLFGEVADLPREKPLENDGHQETNENDADDNNEGGV